MFSITYGIFDGELNSADGLGLTHLGWCSMILVINFSIEESGDRFVSPNV